MNEDIRSLPDLAAVRALNDLSGRVALITGGGSGLGRAMAWGFACNGADIVIVDRDANSAELCASELKTATRRKASAIVADVKDEAAVEDAAKQAISVAGRVDILLNNAGHNVRRPLLDFTLEEFDSLHEVHVRGAFLFCRALGRHMRERRSGSIINIASMLGQVGAINVAPYAAAKAALAQMSRVLALELAPYGVRVNAIAPGYIDTPLTRQHSPETRKRITDLTPLGRFGRASELIGPAVFLASDASSFVTGTVLTVDGGWTAQ
jgi:gluconate 5-dehydrogenase